MAMVLTRDACPSMATSIALLEADAYAEVTRAWYLMYTKGGHIRRPVQPYVLGPQFAQDVWNKPATVRKRVFVVSGWIVSLFTWQLSNAVVARHAPGMGVVPKEALDPATAWWHPLGKDSELGVHFWRLGTGMPELRTVGPLNSPPPLEFGRFAEEESRLLEHVHRAVEEINREED